MNITRNRLSRFNFLFRKNYNLASQTTNRFTDSPSELPTLGLWLSKLPMPLKKSLFWRNMLIIFLPHVIFQLKKKLKKI